MTKEIFYTYLGTNGTITSPVFLEGIYSVKKVRLIADPKKTLTKDNINFHIIVEVSEDDVNNWIEVDL